MLTTRFTQLVGCTVPIQQAGLGMLAMPPLAAAVTNAGGLGMLSVAGGTPEEISQWLDNARALTSGPLGANIVLHFVPPGTAPDCAAAAAAKARVVDFFYADPDPALIEIVHKAGALASWQIGSRAEAVQAADAGCDFIIAQGIEAGGHIRGQTGLLTLLNEVLEAVQIPVLAAGGIGTGRNMAAVLAAGAEGVRVGTRFIAAKESGAHPEYVQALINANASDTVYTTVFAGLWDAPHRVLRASIEAVQAFKGDVVAEGVDPDTGEHFPVPRFASITPRAVMSGTIAAMPHWAGESVAGIKQVQSAAEIVHELAGEAEALLGRWK